MPRASFALTTCLLALVCSAVSSRACAGQAPGGQQPEPPKAAAKVASGRLPTPAENRYNLQPFHGDFPVELELPQRLGLEYDRTRRQMLAQLAANLQGNGQRDAWQMAMEFFWRGPEDAVAPLVEAMDRPFGNPVLKDVVKNCVEAMGKMANEEFDVPLQRALEHPDGNVRQAAFAALATSGKESTLLKMEGWFERMDGRSRSAWLHALRLRLGVRAVPILQKLMMAEYHSSVRDAVLKETLQLPATAAAQILRGRWTEAVGEFKAIIAGVLHAAGDSAGTVWLRDAMQSEDLGMLALAIRHSAFGEPGILRDSLLRASTHLRPEIRLEVARVLTRIEGDDVASVYEAMVSPDEVWEVRAIALRELTRRGRTGATSVLLEELATATGTRVQLLLNQLAASGDARAVPLFVARLKEAPDGERRPFLQALAQNQSSAAVQALFDLFLGPEMIVARGDSGLYTTLNYLPTLMLNLRGHETELLAAVAKIPVEDWRRRALMMPTLTGIAADREDKALQAACLAPIRAILFDRTELPQLRVLALNLLLRRWLTIEDALRLKNLRQEEQPGMRALFNDFLNEYF